MSNLAGRTWFITGTSTGFGKAIAREVLSRGGNVVASARSLDAVGDLVAIAPERVLAAQLDVTHAGQIATSVAAAMERFGRIDVLVNNAGYGFLSAVEEASEEEVRQQFDVNFFGLAAMTRAVLPHMRSAGRGTIINTSSTAASRGSPGAAYYGASKRAVEALSEALAKEAAPLGIKVLIVAPGPFRTDFSGRSIRYAQKTIAAYETAVQMREYARSLHGNQAGDPIRAARIIVDTALDPNAPLRLVLGAQAYLGVMDAHRERLADIERSKDIAPQADYPPEELQQQP
jgi:NAD(P)-dependent dehydrogenase (short-subunit alcohol dehydrogenase family)